ncbi:MAG TPA: hypothetical protein VGP32_05620 [Steroidobacteraceae bacterium]|jgi:hypothetical protein|nr:hypothetical protein [Steroidobacteraceae bacterium]
MRSWLAVVVVLVAMRAPAALADRDPQSGAPLPPAKQQPASPITDHFYVTAAFYDPQLRTYIQADPTPPSVVTTGTQLSGEHYLGLAARPAYGVVEAMVRARERNKVRLDYFETDRSGSVLPTSPVVFGNQVFPAGSQLLSTLDWRMFSVTYTYSFYRSDRLEIGTGLAVYTLDMHAQLAVPMLGQQQVETASGAVPALPLDLTWRVSRRFSLTAHDAYFKATFHDFRGWVADLHEDAQFRWTPNFATGVGYTSTRTSLVRTGGSSSPGNVFMSISGPQAFVRFSF